MGRSPSEDPCQKLKYSMLTMVYDDKRVGCLLKWQKLHRAESATLTKTHPGRLFDIPTPNPAWPPPAKRSFKAALKNHKNLKGLLSYNLNEFDPVNRGKVVKSTMNTIMCRNYSPFGGFGHVV